MVVTDYFRTHLGNYFCVISWHLAMILNFSVCLSVCLPACLPARLPACLPARPPACLPARPPTRPPACLPAYNPYPSLSFGIILKLTKNIQGTWKVSVRVHFLLFLAELGQCACKEFLGGDIPTISEDGIPVDVGGNRIREF